MFVHIAKKATFTEELQTKYTNCIVFIQDTQEIFTHGTFYGVSTEFAEKVTDLESFKNALKCFSKVSNGTTTAAATDSDSTLTFTAGNNVQISVGSGGVTVSATDTKYTAGTGISIGTGNVINHSNSITAGTASGDASKTLTFGGTFTIPSITYDAQGHIKSKTTTTMTMPAAPTFTNWQAKNIVGASATATANAATTNTTTFLNLVENGAVRSSHQIKGAGKVTVASTTDGVMTITGAATTAATGSAKGTIAIDDVDVAVNGLGSAAYTESTAYATAAQGTKADNAVPNTRKVNGHALSADVTVTKSDVGLGKVDNLSRAEILASAALTGTPTAPTPDGSNTNSVANVEYVTSEINDKISAAQALRFKGTIGTGGDVTTLPASHEVGDVYIVKTAGNYAGEGCEIGDMIVCVKTGTVAANADWSVIQRNLDGAVTGKSLTANTVTLGNGNSTVKALANGSNGQILKIVNGVPAWAAQYSYTLPAATASALGGVKLGSDTAQTVAANAVTTAASRTYAVQANADGQLVVNVPWSNTNTTYTFANGTAGNFTVTPAGGSAQTVSVGKPATAGAADTAAKWATARTITVTGGVTGSVSIDGSANATLATTLSNHASNKVTAMTGYSKATDTAAITTSDSLNTAIGKLEAAWDWIEL